MHSEINGQLWYLLRAVNHEREVLESVVAAKVRDTSGVEGSQAHHEVIWLTTERSAPTTFISRRGGKRLPIAGRSLDGQQAREFATVVSETRTPKTLQKFSSVHPAI
jgi:hypothetical protein